MRMKGDDAWRHMAWRSLLDSLAKPPTWPTHLGDPHEHAKVSDIIHSVAL